MMRLQIRVDIEVGSEVRSCGLGLPNEILKQQPESAKALGGPVRSKQTRRSHVRQQNCTERL
jgi:hypothetical protein